MRAPTTFTHSSWGARRRASRRFKGFRSAGGRTLIALSDQAGAAIAGDVDPEPAQGDGKAIAHADQEVDMGEPPDPPRHPAAHLDPAEVDDRRALADGGQVA